MTLSTEESDLKLTVSQRDLTIVDTKNSRV